MDAEAERVLLERISKAAFGIVPDLVRDSQGQGTSREDRAALLRHVTLITRYLGREADADIHSGLLSLESSLTTSGGRDPVPRPPIHR